MLKIDNLNVNITNIRILSDINFNVSKFTSIVGRNGAGKTTLIRAIMKILKLESGSVKFNNIVISDYATHAMSSFGIGYMPEDRRLIPKLTVKENILLPTWINNNNKNNNLESIIEYIPEVKPFLKSDAYQLSGGQQKLVALAGAMIIGRKLLLLDEPFEGVAPALAERLVELIIGLTKLDLITLITESDKTYSEYIGANIVKLERGKIII